MLSCKLSQTLVSERTFHRSNSHDRPVMVQVAKIPQRYLLWLASGAFGRSVTRSLLRYFGTAHEARESESLGSPNARSPVSRLREASLQVLSLARNCCYSCDERRRLYLKCAPTSRLCNARYRLRTKVNVSQQSGKIITRAMSKERPADAEKDDAERRGVEDKIILSPRVTTGQYKFHLTLTWTMRSRCRNDVSLRVGSFIPCPYAP